MTDFASSTSPLARLPIATNRRRRPIAERAAAAPCTTSNPASRAEPASGASAVLEIRTSVVLPAPSGPVSASTAPASALRATPAGAWVSPDTLRIPRGGTCSAPVGRTLARHFRRRDDDHGPVGVLENGVGDATEQQRLDPCQPTRAEHDRACSHLVRLREDRCSERRVVWPVSVAGRSDQRAPRAAHPRRL